MEAQHNSILQKVKKLLCWLLGSASLNHTPGSYASDWGKIQSVYLLFFSSTNHYCPSSFTTKFRSPTFNPQGKIKALVELKIISNLAFYLRVSALRKKPLSGFRNEIDWIDKYSSGVSVSFTKKIKLFCQHFPSAVTKITVE